MVMDLLTDRTLKLLHHIEKRKSKGYCDDMNYPSETAKVRSKILPYIKDSDVVIDIGCGTDLIVPHAFGVDSRDLPTVKLVTNDLANLKYKLPTIDMGKIAVVFSSHCLEHFSDITKAVDDWISLIKDGGYLALYLPDDRYYRNIDNPEHIHTFVMEVFMRWFQATFSDKMNIVECGPDVGPDRYSFYLIGQKKST